jgi:hypothetical protein
MMLNASSPKGCAEMDPEKLGPGDSTTCPEPTALLLEKLPKNASFQAAPQALVAPELVGLAIATGALGVMLVGEPFR